MQVLVLAVMRTEMHHARAFPRQPPTQEHMMSWLRAEPMDITIVIMTMMVIANIMEYEL